MGDVTPERRETEPKPVFEILVHLREGRVAGFLGGLKDDLTPESKYVQSSDLRVKSSDVKLKLKGGRSLKTLGELAEKMGIFFIGVKWRDDIEPKEDGMVDKGVAVLLQFGTDSSRLSQEMRDRWSVAVDRIFNDYLWGVDYHEGGNKIGLFGPTEVVVRKDGSRASDERDKQFVLGDVKVSAGDGGVRYSWGGVEIVLPYD